MTKRVWLWLLPLALFALLLAFLAAGLRLNPSEVPSPLIGKRAPDFSLPLLQSPGKTLSAAELRGKVWLLNVWASWCESCRAEHEVLLSFSQSKDAVPIIGLNYKDKSADASLWLSQFGNPYAASVVDARGRAGMDWGVYGVPETFVMDAQGVIRDKIIGPVTPRALEQRIRPLLARLQTERP